ncbi:kinesin motor protein cin8 [Entomortierella beljakovae]|nr:kinesin motor protein cin8 [Entomortierella beljakovae]
MTSVGSTSASGIPAKTTPTSLYSMQSNSSTSKMSTQINHNNSIAANKELNIQVVVRIRSRSEREVRENSPVAVQSQNKEILVPSTLGDRAPSKSYSFDRVFMYSDQECIYNEVVTPILDEVLTGYNCTIFAYGQTGTGKTYTMEGDLRDSFGECSREAGIIPRTLYSLFAALERKNTEYTVRVSFLELYNEEVKDLLVADDDKKVVKIFDSIKKQGPLVQGLEEFSVFNAMQGIEALRKGSAKRTVAATKSNDKSSRSHGVFSITVHVKETADDGEELLKIGKLNLVDLAGSENIARSGAEATQAKEAGRINQSLLTLGRVINSLVERSQHIPYRESKLTRLLEDSLGGKTKTCIIATISPARSCLEETISTLNYANRAKNIKNTPEINQKMSKKTLIKEYLLEIDRLKADLNATRDKNGVFMTQESYQSLLDENSSTKDLVGETQKQLDSISQELSRVEEKFRENMKILTATEYKLSASNAELENKRVELQEVRSELSQTKQVLQEEKVLRQAHAHAEDQLNVVATNLQSTLNTSMKDIKGLHEKLDRKSEIERENREALAKFQEKILNLTGELGDKLQGFRTRQSDLLIQVTQRMDGAFEEASVGSDDIQSYLVAQIERMDKSLEEFKALDSNTSDKATIFKREFESLRQDMTDFLKSRVEMSKANALEGFDELKNVLLEFTGSIEKHQALVSKKVLGLVDDTTEFSKESISRHQLALESYEKATSNEIKYLTTQNQILRQRLKDQEIKREEQKSVLLTEIGGLLDRFLRDQTGSLLEQFSSSCNALGESADRLNVAHSDQKAWTADFARLGSQRMQGLSGLRSEFEKLSSEAVASNNQEGSALAKNLDTLGTNIEQDLQSQKEFLQTRMFEMNSKAMSGYEEMRSQHLALADIFSLSSTHTTTAFQDLKARLNTAYSYAESTYKQSSINISTAKDLVQILSDDTEQNLDVTRDEIEAFVPRRIKVDDSTGRTPARKNYKYPTTWGRARPSQDLLREFRELGRVKMLTTNQSPDSPVQSNSDDNPDYLPLIDTFEIPSIHSSLPRVEAHSRQEIDEQPTSSKDLCDEEESVGSSKAASDSHPRSPSKKTSQSFVRKEAEKEKENSIGQGAGSALSSVRLVKPVLGSIAMSDFGISRKSGLGNGIKRSASEMSNNTDENVPHLSTMSDINNNIRSTTTPPNPLQQKLNGSSAVGASGMAPLVSVSTSTSSIVTPSSGQFSVTGAFGTGKSGLTNSSEGPRKISRPAPIRPTGRKTPFGGASRS